MRERRTKATKQLKGLLLRPFLPLIGMFVAIPVVQGADQRGAQFGTGFKATAFESQGTQLLPPGFNQVQPAGIFRNELHLHFRPRQQRDLYSAALMDGEIVFNQQPAVT